MKTHIEALELENENFKVIELDKERYEKNHRTHIFYKIKCKKCGNIFSRKKEALNNFENLNCKYCIHNRFGKPLNSPLYEMYIHYIHNAKVRKIEWNLNENEFKDIITKKCTYCDHIDKCTDDTYYSGIDRIDSKKEYSINNCIPCCKICNMMKNKFSKECFLSKIKQIYNNLIKSSTTIPKGSTSQANGDGKGETLNAA